MKSVLLAGLASLAFGAAHASSPDEFTLQPMGVDTSSTVIYSPQTTTTGGSFAVDKLLSMPVYRAILDSIKLISKQEKNVKKIQKLQRQIDSIKMNN